MIRIRIVDGDSVARKEVAAVAAIETRHGARNRGDVGHRVRVPGCGCQAALTVAEPVDGYLVPLVEDHVHEAILGDGNAREVARKKNGPAPRPGLSAVGRTDDPPVAIQLTPGRVDLIGPVCRGPVEPIRSDVLLIGKTGRTGIGSCRGTGECGRQEREALPVVGRDVDPGRVVVDRPFVEIATSSEGQRRIAVRGREEAGERKGQSAVIGRGERALLRDDDVLSVGGDGNLRLCGDVPADHDLRETCVEQ